jgi:hypothetical protein
MAITTRIGRRTFLSLLLILATAITTQNVEAKVFTSSNVLPPSDLSVVERTLQQEVAEQQSGKENSANNAGYIPFEKGTRVRFEDQDGTKMFGIVWDYDSSSQTYTIQWDEDSINEDFSNLKKIEQMVNAAKESKDDRGGDSPISAREQEEDNDDAFDFDFTYEYEDLSDYDSWSVGTHTLLEFADGWFMGEITQFLLSIDKKNATYVVTWSNGATDSFYNELEWVDLMVANAEDYEPWEIGTPAYGYPNPDSEGQESGNSYFGGEITSFEDGVYSVTWSNSDIVGYHDFDLVDSLVNNAAYKVNPSWTDNYNPWPKGTAVTWDFDDGWWEGTITDFADGTYQVTWTDGSSKFYSDLEKVDQMVAFASGEGYQGNLGQPTQHGDSNDNNDNFYAEYYDLETVVYADFQDGSWAGYIDSYENEYYVIRWSDDTVDKFLPGNDIDEMVLQGQSIPEDYNIFPEGTEVYKDFDGTWYWGTIEYSNGGFYTIIWEDGERTTYVSGSEIDEMVNNAYKGDLPFGRIAFALVILSCVGGIAFLVISKKQQRLATVNSQVRDNELVLTERGHADYSDQQSLEGDIPAVV